MATWFLIMVGAAALGVWSVVVFDRFSQRRTRMKPDRLAPSARASAIRWIIVLAWGFSVLPSLLAILENGRQGTEFSVTTLVLTQTPGRLATVISTILVFACFRLIVIYFHVPPTASIWRLGAFLAPWLTIQALSGVGTGYVSGRQFILYPLIAVTFWLVSPPYDVARTVGVLAAGTAAFSIAFAFVSDLGLVSAGSAGMVKAIIGDGSRLLAGPYSSSNSLAISLALGAPCALLIKRVRWRVAALAVIGLALLWTAGRTSILAAAVGLGVYVVAAGGERRFRVVALVVALVGVGLVAWTPFHVHDPAAFTSRGVIWIASLADWHHHIWLGAGPQYFERNDLPFYLLPFKIVHGHNIVVDTLERGGLVGVAAVATWLAVLFRQAWRMAGLTPFPLVFLITFVYVSWLEVPINFGNLGYAGYVSWLPLAVICFTRSTAPSVQENPALDLVTRRASVGSVARV